MATAKTALLSPAVNAQQQMPSSQDEQQLFEDKFGQMAYQAFSSKFPDLVAEIVTFKILDSDLEVGTGVGSFILEQEGDCVYVPCVLSANELKPFDMMYVKSKDIFLPLSNEWLEEVKKGTISSLGEGSKLPDTVPTDVDIRNIVVPPTTGRYSYASFNAVTSRNRLEAQATEPLGRKLAKIAGVGPFPGGAQQGMPGAQQSDFNPQLWATFVEQFQRTQKVTPGQALDTGSLDIETMAKMYKSHTKTWEMMADPSANPLANAQAPGLAADGSDAGMAGQMGQQQPQQAQPQQAAPAQPMQPQMQRTAAMKTANPVADMATGPMPRTLGSKLEGVINNIVRSAGLGAVSGGVSSAVRDDGGSDVGGGMLRGAAGGALLGPLGSVAGEELAAQAGAKVDPTKMQNLGRLIGSVGGGYVGSHSEPLNIQLNAQQGMDRYAADYNSDLKGMLKHALKSNKYKPRLPEFLTAAPNHVKEAYVKVLQQNPALLKKAADIYGEDTLVTALKTRKTAGVTNNAGSLRVADKNTNAKGYTEAFGEDAPTAFRGVAMRGYYFKDTRPKLNLAVQVQEYHDFQDAMNSGVYRLYTVEGTPKAALVLAEPFDLTSDSRITFPDDDSRVKRPETKVPVNELSKEPNSSAGFQRKPFADPDVARSHKYKRLAVLENGDYFVSDKLFGEEVSENFLKGSTLYNSVMKTGKSAPSKGTGVFVTKRGTSYLGSLPVEISEMSTGSNGVIRGKISSRSGIGAKAFVIDPRSPVNRPMKTDGLVVIPASWKWVSLKENLNSGDFLRSASSLSDVVHNALGSMGAHEAVVRSAGQSMFDVAGARTITKNAALQLIATKYNVHASAAEAMLKIASHTGICRAHIVTPAEYQTLRGRVKIAQGEASPQTQMGSPPAMQNPALAVSPVPVSPAPAPAPPGLPPAMQDPAASAAPPTPSPVDQAFGEAMDSLQEQMSALQAQLEVLSTVQQRAQEIAGGGAAAPAPGAPPAPPAQGAPPPDPSMQGAPPQDPSMQGMPPGMDPAMGTDPNADPNAQAQEPSMPIMRTEEPSSDEIAAQINPAFLGQAANLHETGAFDAGTIASLARSSNMKSVTSQYAASLEESVDDLGRTLLTLYMQEPKLKEQLGDDTFLDLETQLRDTFQGLGKLVLSLTHNASMLDPNALS